MGRRNQNKTEQNTEKPQVSLKEINQIINSKETNVDLGVDLCFLVDVTGSMASSIYQVKTNIISLFVRFYEHFPNAHVRFSFVGYRDLSDTNQYIVYQFTPNPKKLEYYINMVQADGGGDTPENVLGGIDKVFTLDWQSKTRIMYHICDAPPHGTRFHTSDDNYPDYNEFHESNLMPILEEKKILYYFGKINYSTDNMIDIFNKYLKDQQIVVMDNSNMKYMLDSFFDSIKRSIEKNKEEKDTKTKK